MDPEEYDDDQDGMEDFLTKAQETLAAPETFAAFQEKHHQTLILLDTSNNNPYYLERSKRLLESVNQADTIKCDVGMWNSAADNLTEVAAKYKAMGYNQVLISLGQ